MAVINHFFRCFVIVFSGPAVASGLISTFDMGLGSSFGSDLGSLVIVLSPFDSNLLLLTYFGGHVVGNP